MNSDFPIYAKDTANKDKQFWKWDLLFSHQMLIEHIQGSRNWEYNHGQPPWVHGHATPSFCTDRGRGGGGKPTLALIMLDGPALPRWSVIFSSAGGEKVFRHDHPGQSHCSFLCGLWESSLSLSVFSWHLTNHLPSSGFVKKGCKPFLTSQLSLSWQS